MANTAPGQRGPGKKGSTKLTREQKKEVRAGKRAKRRETFSNLKQAFTLTRQSDPNLVWLLVGAGVLVAAVVYGVVYLITSSFYTGIPFAVLLGVLAALLLFSRRAQRAMYSQADGQPGAAGYLLQNQLRGRDWHTTPAVAGTGQLDAVHRVIGRPGVVLVGEGAPQRVRGLLAQERRKVARVVGDTPIYQIVVGSEDEEVPLAKLNAHMAKLPRNLTSAEVSALERRMAALTSVRPPIPQGPMPAQAKARNLQRAVRRRS